jgi:hypothetical protein
MVSDSIGNGSVAPNDTSLLLSFVATIIVGNTECSVVPVEAIDSVALCHFFALPLSLGGNTCFPQIAFW